MKIIALTLMAAMAFASTTVFAGDKCCAKGEKKVAMSGCSKSLDKLDLTAEQKTKMEALIADCEKNGCTESSMAKLETEAKSVLSEPQFVAFQEASCLGKKDAKKQS